jgi:hypothetical protein
MTSACTNRILSDTTSGLGLELDRALPTFDVEITESMVVDADPASTYEGARGLDFLRVRTPLLAAAFWVRGFPARLARRPVRVPPRRVLGERDPLPGWPVLGETPGSEIAFGAVGKFWQGTIVWRDVARDEFAIFDEPGFGKIACDLRVRPCGPNRTLLTYECRTATTSADAQERFRRYWRLIRPFVGHIMRATLATIRRDAEALYAAPIRPTASTTTNGEERR